MPVRPHKLTLDVPRANCPSCGLEEYDFDGVGVLSHTQPAYPYGCGWCSHPSRDDGVCGFCGQRIDRNDDTDEWGGG